jgi:superfamily II DNA or RNA helicase
LQIFFIEIKLMNQNQLYTLYIYQRTSDLIKSGKTIEQFDNYDIALIFEYYCCIVLSTKLKRQFYQYDDIDNTFKEDNKMSRKDTGIDVSDMKNIIVQCKLRGKTLNWRECATFFASQNSVDFETGKPFVRWDNLVIFRNEECILSENLTDRLKWKMFHDAKVPRQVIINYCKRIYENPPIVPTEKSHNIQLRDYQIEAIAVCKQEGNSIINLPTGSGKNYVILGSFELGKKYLVLVPRIILMEQFAEKLSSDFPIFKNKYHMLGNGRSKYMPDKDITVCVYNSVVNIPPDEFEKFDKIYVDEAHHIVLPEIYQIDYTVNDEFNQLLTDPNEEDEEYEDDDDENEENTDDERKNTYIDIISDLKIYVYLSATIDQNDDFNYYSKDIRDMIDDGYLVDYSICIPVFAKPEIDDYSVCQYLIKTTRNTIVYCSDCAKEKQINNTLNSIMNGCSKYIDYTTTKKERKRIISEYTKGIVPFLVNVKILTEGFDAPITKNIVLSHIPSSSTTLIQIIGRGLRPHPEKNSCRIILPFSNDDDDKDINNFLKTVARNDKKICKSFHAKKTGGYIQLTVGQELEINDEMNDEQIEKLEEQFEMNIECKFEKVYDSMGKMVNNVEWWKYKFEQLKKFIDENDRTPLRCSKSKKEKRLNEWLFVQKGQYKNKAYIMKEYEIYNIWENFINHQDYKKYFISNIEQWKITFEEVKKFIISHNKTPLKRSKNRIEKSLGQWFQTQKHIYKNKLRIMNNNKEIRNIWTDFMNHDDYKKYFISNVDQWKIVFQQLIVFINSNHKIPTHSNDKQLANYQCSLTFLIYAITSWIFH